VLGLAATGSRAAGFDTPESDFDSAVFAEEGEVETVSKRLGKPPLGVDMTIFTPSSFTEHAAWGSDSSWDRYAWSIAHFVVDRTNGKLVEVAREKGRVHFSHLDAYINASLDWYLHQVARSFRCLHCGMEAAGYLNGAEAARPFLQAVLAFVKDGSLLSHEAVLDLAGAVFPEEGYSRRFQEWETEGRRSAYFHRGGP